jgi:hypothetical protein
VKSRFCHDGATSHDCTTTYANLDAGFVASNIRAATLRLTCGK